MCGERDLDADVQTVQLDIDKSDTHKPEAVHYFVHGAFAVIVHDNLDSRVVITRPLTGGNPGYAIL